MWRLKASLGRQGCCGRYMGEHRAEFRYEQGQVTITSQTGKPGCRHLVHVLGGAGFHRYTLYGTDGLTRLELTVMCVDAFASTRTHTLGVPRVEQVYHESSGWWGDVVW